MLWFVKMLLKTTTTTPLNLPENWKSIKIVNIKDISLNLMHRKIAAFQLSKNTAKLLFLLTKFCSPLLT